jgi:hypothetical protein
MTKMDNAPTLLAISFILLWMAVSVAIVLFLAILKIIFTIAHFIKMFYKHIKIKIKHTLLNS